jgi:hypothetical protein
MESATSHLAVEPASTTVTNDSALTLQNTTEEVKQEDVSPTIYVEGYESPEAKIVLMGTDNVGLRVHDYYLKAAR